MKLLVQFILICFLYSIPASLEAQTPADTLKVWDLNDCFQYAFKHNIQIATSRLNEQSTRQDLLQSKAQRIPSLSSTLGNTFTHAKNQDTVNRTSLVDQIVTSGIYTLNSSVILWNDNALKTNVREKNLLTQSAGFSVQEIQNSITFSITTAYLNALLAKENLKYVADLVNTTEALEKQGELFYQVGTIAKKDLLQLQAQLASDRFLLVQAQNAIRQNILNLKQILQLPSEVPFDVKVPSSVDITEVLPPLQQVQQAALLSFPEVKISKLSVDISSLEIARLRAGLKPALSASGAVGTNYNSFLTNPFGFRGGYFTQAGNNFYQSIGITLSIPIFLNRINKTNVEKAKISYSQSVLNLQNTQLVLTQQVEQAYLSASNANQSYKAAQEQLVAATESYRIANEQLKIGAVSTVDLLQQRNQYVQAVQAFIQSKYTALLQHKIYEYYLGIPITL